MCWHASLKSWGCRHRDSLHDSWQEPGGRWEEDPTRSRVEGTGSCCGERANPSLLLQTLVAKEQKPKSLGEGPHIKHAQGPRKDPLWLHFQQEEQPGLPQLTWHCWKYKISQPLGKMLWQFFMKLNTPYLINHQSYSKRSENMSMQTPPCKCVQQLYLEIIQVPISR